MSGQWSLRGGIALLVGVLSFGVLTAAAQNEDEASPDENRALIQEYVEAISGQEKTEELMDQYIAATDTFLREHIRTAEAAFPRYELIVDDIIAEGDKVVLRATARGTHEGEFAGIPPTGRDVEFAAIIIYRIEDGLIAETWIQADMVGLLQQLGALPLPDTTAEPAS